MSVGQRCYYASGARRLPGDILVSVDTWISVLAVLGLPRLCLKRPLFALWLVFGMAFLLLWNTEWSQYVLIILVPLCLSGAELVIMTGAGLYSVVRRSVLQQMPAATKR